VVLSAPPLIETGFAFPSLSVLELLSPSLEIELESTAPLTSLPSAPSGRPLSFLVDAMGSGFCIVALHSIFVGGSSHGLVSIWPKDASIALPALRIVTDGCKKNHQYIFSIHMMAMDVHAFSDFVLTIIVSEGF
jgi:hypothetical protein